MNYVLTSYRKVNGLSQGVAVRMDASSLTEHNTYLKMKSWANLVASLDSPSWNVGSIKFSGLCVNDATGNNNNGELADVDVVVNCGSSIMPKLVTFRLTGVSQSNFVSKVQQKMLSIFEVIDGSYVVVNVAFDLKQGVS